MAVLLTPQGHVLPLPAGAVSLGADPSNEVPVAPQFELAAVHFRLQPWEGGHFIEDAGSGLGTRVNGHPIHWKPLIEGDVITAGSLEAVYSQKSEIPLSVTVPSVATLPSVPASPPVPGLPDPAAFPPAAAQAETHQFPAASSILLGNVPQPSPAPPLVPLPESAAPPPVFPAPEPGPGQSASLELEPLLPLHVPSPPYALTAPGSETPPAWLPDDLLPAASRPHREPAAPAPALVFLPEPALAPSVTPVPDELVIPGPKTSRKPKLAAAAALVASAGLLAWGGSRWISQKDHQAQGQGQLLTSDAAPAAAGTTGQDAIGRKASVPAPAPASASVTQETAIRAGNPASPEPAPSRPEVLPVAEKPARPENPAATKPETAAPAVEEIRKAILPDAAKPAPAPASTVKPPSRPRPENHNRPTLSEASAPSGPL